MSQVPRGLGFIDGPGPVLEAADVIDLSVTHVLEQLARKRRSPAGGAIQDHRFILVEILVVVRRFRVGAEFQHAPRNVDGAGNLAARGDFGRVADIDHQGVALADHLAGLLRRNLGNGSVRHFQHLFDACCHRILPALSGQRGYLAGIAARLISRLRTVCGAEACSRRLFTGSEETTFSLGAAILKPSNAILQVSIMEGAMTALVSTIFHKTSANSLADIETLTTVALFSAIGLLISIATIVFDKYPLVLS